MSLIRRNLIANFAGQGWTALMGFVFVPLYLRFVGAEGYGVIGFFVLLTSTLAVLDMGFQMTAMREVAGFADADDEGKNRIATLLRSIEVCFWVIASLAGLVVGFAAPLLANHWLKVEALRVSEITAAIRLMAVALLIQFPIDFYSGCLIGLQKQVRLNVITSVCATLRGLGAVLVLWAIAPTVQMFFAWQCVLSLIMVLWLRLSLWGAVESGRQLERFNLGALREVGRFTAGVGGTRVFGYLLTQIDKIILSKVLPLPVFGYYTLAWILGTFAYRFIGPIFNAYYPRIAQLVSQAGPEHMVNPDEKAELVQLYLRAGRVMAVAIVPFSVWLAFYGQPLLALWTHDKAIAEVAAGAVALIALGTMCNGLMHIPYSLQLATGWIGLAFWSNVISVFVIVPLTYYFATHYGLTGAAVPWLLINLSSVFIGAQLLYRLMFKSAKWNWYRTSVVYPFLQAAFVIGMCYYVSTQLTRSFGASAMMFFSLFASVTIGLLTSRLVTFRELAGFALRLRQADIT